MVGGEFFGGDFPGEEFGVDPDFLFVVGDPAVAEVFAGGEVDEASVDVDAEVVVGPFESVGVEVVGDFEGEAVVVFPDALAEGG